MANLRDYKTYTIGRSLQSPIMFWGMPLILSIAYLSTFVVFAITAMLMISNSVGIIITIVVCVGGGGFCLGGIKLFYKTYGIDGFQLKKRDESLPSSFICDKSVNQILRERTQNIK